MTPVDPMQRHAEAGPGLSDQVDRRYLRRPVGVTQTLRANRRWWDAQAGEYYAEHGAFLGDDELVWGPEGWRESQLRLLGEVSGKRVLEIGAGAAQGSRYLLGRGARVVASDLSGGMLARARAIDAARAGTPAVPLIHCDAALLPFADGSLEVVFSSYGAVPFIADTAQLMRECRRVLRPGGRLVFSTTHPFRWAFPDQPDESGLTVAMSYFDRTPYVELSSGRTDYVEHHRTLGDRVRELVAAGFRLVDVVEPEWPDATTQTWGGWSPLRGRMIPGTAIFVAQRE
ncbi:MAG TPA: methyltransferase domain-containing protein [Dermatophilaceae bacterium]|nr:methyltransferase domain-containing protein [Dermatophilaceae bacterium]